jgi:hypothetical protein
VSRPPDYYIFFQKADSVGRPESAGGLAFSTFTAGVDEPTAPVSIHNDPVVRSSAVAAVTRAGIRSISLNEGSARVLIGGGDVTEPVFETLEMPLAPDLAIAACSLSNPFPGAGARLTALVEVENRGTAGSAVDDSDASVCGVRAVFVAADGSERVAAQSPLGEVPPGGSAFALLDLEMPLDPVSLRVEVSPNPGDANPSNDTRVCPLGAPPPTGLVCETVLTGEEDQPYTVHLSWSNPVPYEEVLVYRDGLQFAALPGSATSCVDRYTTDGTHAYEVRGRIEVSRSRRQAVECSLEVVPPNPTEAFRRGDVDGNGTVELTDVINLLNFLYLGGSAPSCPDAADEDDSGVLELTDVINILGFLYLGGAEPAAPGPFSCGSDPTGDTLGPCGGSCQ